MPGGDDQTRDPGVADATGTNGDLSRAAAARRQADVLRRQIAVALSYDADKDVAPQVIASGRDDLAARLMDLAFSNGVPVRQDADLAEMLVAVEVGEIIPLEAFSAVAEIIAYLYKANTDLVGADSQAAWDRIDAASPLAAEEVLDGGATRPMPATDRGEDAIDRPATAGPAAVGLHGSAAGHRPVGGGLTAGYGPTGAWRGTGGVPAGSVQADRPSDTNDATAPAPRPKPRSA